MFIIFKLFKECCDDHINDCSIKNVDDNMGENYTPYKELEASIYYRTEDIKTIYNTLHILAAQLIKNANSPHSAQVYNML